MLNLSVGIMAYNEEANIGRLLETLSAQELGQATLSEIIVVASGCTDRTVEIVGSRAQSDPRIRLLAQEKREGKASAINLFLSQASGDILILESADTFPAPGALSALIAPFSEESTGMTGARPVPVNPRDTFLGYTVHLMWSLHHQISLQRPKLGELIAFRNCIAEIPRDTAVDEACLEALLTEKGYGLRYVETAVVYNKGPETVADFIRQRRRIAAGHLHLRRTMSYRVSTANPWGILICLLRRRSPTAKEAMWVAGAILLEAVGRFQGYLDFLVLKRNPVVWDIAASTKQW